MSKSRINVSLDEDLAEFAKSFAAENRTSVADIFTQYLLSLKRNSEGEEAVNLYANPAFQKAMEEAQVKLHDGTAKWSSYDKVFD